MTLERNVLQPQEQYVLIVVTTRFRSTVSVTKGHACSDQSLFSSPHGLITAGYWWACANCRCKATSRSHTSRFDTFDSQRLRGQWHRNSSSVRGSVQQDLVIPVFNHGFPAIKEGLTVCHDLSIAIRMQKRRPLQRSCWEAAVKFCKSSSGRFQTPWRKPSIQEFKIVAWMFLLHNIYLVLVLMPTSKMFNAMHGFYSSSLQVTHFGVSAGWVTSNKAAPPLIKQKWTEPCQCPDACTTVTKALGQSVLHSRLRWIHQGTFAVSVGTVVCFVV